MNHTLIEHSEGLRIGVVDFVSPDEIKVMLDIEAPENIALNAGDPRPFPRVNGYVLIPVDEGFLVGQVGWITIERSPFPKRRGMQDFGLIDLPFPLRKLSVGPLGILRKKTGVVEEYSFKRGAGAFPSVGAKVLLPTALQLRSVVESGSNRRVSIGTSPLANNADVSIDPDKLFGRHVAVLGNTGSGKSCSVAGLIRWSVEKSKAKADSKVNARFIVLDPNGEYSRSFKDAGLNARVFRVQPEAGEKQLQVPLWLWNSAEWSSFLMASSKTQRPTLVQALRSLRSGHVEPAKDANHDMRRFLRSVLGALRIEYSVGTPWGGFPKSKNFTTKLETWKASVESDLKSFSGDAHAKLSALTGAIETLCAARRVQYPNWDFTKQEIQKVMDEMSDAYKSVGGVPSEVDTFDADIPKPFTSDSLVRSVEATAEMLNVTEHTETLLIRLKSLMADKRLKSIIGESGAKSVEEWLAEYVGDETQEGCISVLDLSLVPSEVVHIITAVVARLVFESLQRYRKINGVTYPTVLVMEEAHTFVKRYRDDIDNPDAAAVCCQVFEKIAKEGRKFGLGLVLSSQRPSELSATVLSQCNTFLLHRISNDRDQELVNRLVPDNLKGLLRELPSLPSQNAILLGWATEIPVLVRMNDLPFEHRPHSDDPDYWDVWTGRDKSGEVVKRDANWSKVAEDWLGTEKNLGPDDFI